MVRVLLVEDNPGDRDLILELLEETREFEVEVCETLKGALEALKKRALDLVILDLMLPDSQGLDTLVKLREQASGIPVVVLTGLADEELAMEAVRSGAQDYLVKGKLEAELLARHLRYAIERQSLLHTLEERGKALQTLVNTDADALLIVDRGGLIRFANPAAEALFGHPREELIGTPFGFPVETGKPFEIDLPQADGSVRTGEARAAEMPWEGKPSYVLSIRDVTETKRAKEESYQKLRMLKALYRAAEDFISLLDEREMAEKACRICVEILGVKLAWVGRKLEDGRVELLAQWPTDHPYPRGITVRWDAAPEGQGPTGRAIRSGTPQVTADIASDPLFGAWREAASSHGFRSSAAFPLLSQSSASGTLNLYSDTPGFFTPEQIDLFQALANQLAGALENARLLSETQKQLHHIQAFRRVDLAITSSLDLDLTIQVLVDEVTKQLEADAAGVLLLEPHTFTLRLAGARGFRSPPERMGDVPITSSFGRQLIRDRLPVRLTREELPREVSPGYRKLWEAEGFVEAFFAPLVSKGKPLGILGGFYRRKPSEEIPIDFLKDLAAQTAIALENAQLLEDLRRSNLDLRAAYETTLESWGQLLELRDMETQGHTERVAELTVRLAQKLGMGEEELTYVRWGALLHDIGKLGVPDSVLLKPGKLTPEEWEEMKKHPEYAYETLSKIEFLRPALDIPYCHHERWDGNGYPRGLKGEEIPLSARIFAVVDAWDAMRSDRPYRKALPVEEAIEEIKKGAGTQFDPRIVKAFLELYQKGEI